VRKGQFKAADSVANLIQTHQFCLSRYERQKSVPETYSIIQMGVCLFHHVENDGKNEDGKEGKSEYMAVRLAVPSKPNFSVLIRYMISLF